MKIWLFLETLRALRWGVRYGRRWRIVKEVKVSGSMTSQKNKISPNAVLQGIGRVSFKKGTANLEFVKR